MSEQEKTSNIKKENNTVSESQRKNTKSSEALNMLNKKSVKKKKKKSFKDKTISFFTNFDNYKIILIGLVIGIALIVTGLKVQIGQIEDSNSIFIGTIIGAVLIGVGSGFIVGGIVKQRRIW